MTDLQLNANQKVDNYCNFFSGLYNVWRAEWLSWAGIRAMPNVGNQNYSNLINLAILNYQGAPSANPSDPTKNIPSSVLSLNETDLHVGLVVRPF